MSSSDRRAFLLGLSALSLLPGGCGFAPAYGTGGAAEGLRGRVRVADPTDRDTFQLFNRLEDRLGRPEAPIYDLAVGLNTKTESTAITTQQETTRYDVIGTADFTLTDRRSGRQVAKGTVRNFTGYSATGSTVATLTAKRNAFDRLMVGLADQIVTRLVAISAGWPE